jgi:hypothetical protein
VYQYTVVSDGEGLDVAERQQQLAKVYRLLIRLARRRRAMAQAYGSRAEESKHGGQSS